MKEKEKTDEEFVKNGYDVMNELSLLGAACDAMTYKVSPVDDEDNIMGFFHGAASVLNRASEDVCRLVEQFEILSKQSAKGEADAGSEATMADPLNKEKIEQELLRHCQETLADLQRRAQAIEDRIGNG